MNNSIKKGTASYQESRRGAEEFPLMVIISVLYPCNFGCPNCPYTDGNSDLRKFYKERNGDYFPEKLWQKIALEAGGYQSWLRCTGGGEPMMHPKMVEMVEFAKQAGARIWMNTNGSLFGPQSIGREKLKRVIAAGIDLIEFSMDAGDAETYATVRPLKKLGKLDLHKRWQNQVSNVQAALTVRKELKKPTRIVVSIIRQQIIEDKLNQAVDFWLNEVGVDEVITRKYLTWDDNTILPFTQALDPHLYANLPTEKKEPCVWPFERMNVDTLGRIALCGQDISFHTAELFPNAWDVPLKEIWLGERFNWYRRLHLDGKGAEATPCRGCSAWKAGIRDWEYGWLKVLKTSGQHLKDVMKYDLGADVDIYEPK